MPAAGGPKLAYAQISKPLKKWAMMRRHVDEKVKPDRPFPFVVAPGRPPLNSLYRERIGDQQENMRTFS